MEAATESRPEFCAVVGGQCPYPVKVLDNGVTLAYPFLPWRKSWAEETAEVARSQGVPPYLPHLYFSSGYVICDVCQEIRARPLHLSEASEPNWNVFFEAGFAFGSGKTVVLAENANAQTESMRSVFSDYLRATYHEKSELITKLLEAARKPGLSIAHVVANVQPRQFYLIDPGVISDEVHELKRTLRRIRGLDYAATDGGMISPAHSMHSVLRDLKGAGAVVGLLLPRDYKDQDLANARACFFLGVAVALEKPVLILRQEPVSVGPSDLKECARSFSSLATLRTLVDDWAKDVLSAKSAVKVVVAPTVKGDILALDLGNAWAERDPALNEYFLETAQYRRARDARTTVFLGRRGSGKSAISLRLTDSEIQGHGTALGAVRPAEFEMQELQGAYERVAKTGGPHWKLLLGTIWRYLLLSQLARTYLRHLADKAGSALETADLSALIERIPHGDDFVDAVVSVTDYLGNASEAEVRSFRAEMSREAVFTSLLRISRQTPGRLIVDGLEEGWAVNHELGRYVVASLIREAERINQRLNQRAAVILFIRTEIYDVVKLADPDIDKQSRERLTWDTESLVELVGLRLNYLLDQKGSPRDGWLSVFPSTVQGVESADYMVRMTLRRPRELIKFCSAAIEHAQARRSKHVSERDVLDAERTYSEDLLTDLNGEYQLEMPDLYTFVSEFAGQAWPIPMEQMRTLIGSAIRNETIAGRRHAWHDHPNEPVDAILKRLYDAGIFGLSAGGREVFSFDRSFQAARALLSRTERVLYKRKSVRTIRTEPDVVLHPGLRPALGANGVGRRTKRRPPRKKPGAKRRLKSR